MFPLRAGRKDDPLSASPVGISGQKPSAVKTLTGSCGGSPSGGGLSPPALSDDEFEGAQRLRPDPDSPTSRLLEAAARRSLENAASQQTTPDKRFSL